MGERLRIERDGNRFELHGEFDLNETTVVQQALAAMDDQEIVIDLVGVTFIDSSGLRCLLRQRELHAGLHYVNPSPQLVRLADITGLTEVLFAD